MFPDFDESVMASVLQSVNWNQDRAVEILLGMSDPEYKPPAEEQRAPLTQEELDEQFARQLVLQDQEAHARAVAQYEQQQGQRPDDPRYQQHRRASPEPRTSSSQGQNQGQQGQGEPDPMAEIGQQLKEGLEVGKKTLNSWFNRAKQKYSEFEQQRQQQATASASTPPQQPWGQNPADQSYAYYQPPGGISTSASGQPHSAGITSAGSQHSSFYDPNPASPISPIEPQQQQPTGRPSIDGGKFGVLPKRPVSLIADDHSPITLSDNTSSTKVQTTSPTTTTTPAAATFDEGHCSPSSFKEKYG
ncbi:hypothetical protein DL96DRAFT_1686060 [Flagelloscypha sp. PMI_526]|nr:hypothetical protein DL96DRAFT_1686060 [Flagelloscypha sp. PMI_526]